VPDTSSSITRRLNKANLLLPFGLTPGLIAAVLGQVLWANGPYDASKPKATKTDALRASSLHGRLRLKNEDFIDGWFAASSREDGLSWKHPELDNAIAFDPIAIRSFDWEGGKPTAPLGQFNVLLHDGDSLYGDLLEWNEQSVHFRSSTLGDLWFDPASIRYLRRRSDQTTITYQGPYNLQHWTTLDSGNHWSIESSGLVSRQTETKIRGNVGLSERCQIDFRLSWNRSPSFVLSLGVGPDQTASVNAFSMEVWEDKLALVRQVPSDVDATFLEPLESKSPSHVKLTVYLDQRAGRAVVYSESGKLLADMTVKSDKPEILPCLLLANYGRELRLDQLVVQPWKDQLPVDRNGIQRCVVDTEGKVMPGTIRSWRPGQGIDVDLRDGGTTMLPMDRLAEFCQERPALDALPKPNDADPSQNKTAAPSGPPPLNDPSLEASRPFAQKYEALARNAADQSDFMTFTLLDQTRINGHWLSNDASWIRIKPVASIRDAVRVPIAMLHSIRGIRREYKSTSVTGRREGRLSMEGLQLQGFLVASTDGAAGDAASPLRWHPKMGLSSCSLNRQASGSIDFRKLSPSTPGKQTQPLSESQLKALARNGQLDPRRSTSPKIELRSGDLIPGKVDRIDEKGITFQSPFSSSTFLPHEEVQSIDLNRMPRVKSYSAEKLNRLLTVPRSRKNDPPSHLITSTDGDYLRGRLIGLKDNELEAEVKLQPVRLNASKIARIVWLHDRNWESDIKPSPNDPGKEPPAPQPDGEVSLVHCVDRSGLRLTFSPKETTEEKISGTSQWLGECSMGIATLEIVLFGIRVQERAREWNMNPWVLALAKQPRVYDEESGEGGASAPGTLSPLVGQPAPKLEGETLIGKSFKLSELKGKVVVLDFWASWCGPCMQTMPVVDRIVEEVGGPDAMLIGVNLEEPAERAQAALTRLKLEMEVVLDVDGVAGKRYQANAIPQTVIIDRDGIVRQVFVGGGNRFAQQFQAALEEVVNGKKSD
jgi:thiol-disulfide isomerase/thioredoxin